jgi:hypothetical protein
MSKLNKKNKPKKIILNSSGTMYIEENIIIMNSLKL